MAHLYIPEGVDLGFLPKTYQPAAEWMLHSIYTQRTCKKLRRDAYVRLHSKILQRMMGDKYAKIKSALEAHGIIEDDGKPIRNVKATGYRLTEGYRDRTHRRHELTGKVLAKRLQKHQDQRRGLWSPVHHHLYNWLSHVELPVSDKRYTRQSLNIARIQDRDWFLLPDKYGRVHTNVTNLKTSLRHKLLVNNVELVELDINNSQPLMFSLLLVKQLQDQIPIPSHTLPLCSGFSMSSRNTIPEDVRHYIELCEQGQLYEMMMAYLGIQDRMRQKTKRRIISRVFYCRNREQNNDLSRAFGELFPNVLDAIKWHKKDDYRHLPRNMQRVEADLVVHKVCGRLMVEHPDVPVLTVHDAILTPQDSAALVTDVLLDEAAKLGIRPTVKVKRQNPRCT